MVNGDDVFAVTARVVPRAALDPDRLLWVTRDLLVHDALVNVTPLQLELLEREARRLHHYVVMLKDRNDPWGEWFESDIEGTYDHCYSQVRVGSLDMHFDIQIVEA